jgi:hypothetical protein
MPALRPERSFMLRRFRADIGYQDSLLCLPRDQLSSTTRTGQLLAPSMPVSSSTFPARDCAQMHRIDTDYANSCSTAAGTLDAEAARAVAQTTSSAAARRAVARSRLPCGCSARFSDM